MKHRIVGDHHQLLAVELSTGEEFLVFNAKQVFSKGDAALVEKGQLFAGTGIGDASLLNCSGEKGVIGIVPRQGGHLKRIEISPPSGLIVRAESIFALSRGVTVASYKPASELATVIEAGKLVTLTGMGMGFVTTSENFMEFALGSGDELKASVENIVAFTGGMKLNLYTASGGHRMLLFSGPGNLILCTG